MTSNADDHGAPGAGPASGHQAAPHWLERPVTVKAIVWVIVLLSVVVLLGDFLVHKHSPFAIEHVFGFYGIYGFVGCVFLVLAAKLMRVVLMRPEDYYDR